MFSFRKYSTRTGRTIGAMALGLFALTLVTATACSKKDAATKEGAAELKAALERSLERQMLIYRPDEFIPGLQYDGEVIVVPQGDHYDVTMPHMRIVTLDGGEMDVGQIKMQATAAGPNLWQKTWAWPTHLTGFDDAGTKRVELSIGSQSATGLWNAEFDYHTNLDIHYSDLSVEFTLPEGLGHIALDIGNVTSTREMIEQSADLYSGTEKAVLEDVRFTITTPFSAEPVTGRIAHIYMGGSMVNGSLKNIYDFETRMTSYAEADPEDLEVGVAMMNDVMNHLTSFADAGDSTMSLQGIEVTFDSPNAPGTPMNLQMDELSFGLGLKDLNSNAISIALSYGMEGLNLSPAPPPVANFLPFSLVLNFDTKNLPNREAFAGWSQTQLQTGIDAKNDPLGETQIHHAQIVDETEQNVQILKDALSQAGTVLNLDGTRISIGGLDARLNGDVRASSSATMGAMMDMRLVIKGVEKAMTALSQPDIPPVMMQQGMMGLGMLQAMGKAEVGEDGGNVLVFNLELTEDGSTLLNGKPMPVPGLGGATATEPMPNEPPMPLP